MNMKHGKSFLINLLVAICLLWSTSCAKAGNASSSKVVLVGSTPGETLIKSLLNINSEQQIDFIRWDLTLDQDQKFSLNINFGEGQPNTNGFKGGGERLALTGIYTVSKNIYELKNEGIGNSISLVKLNDNLFHLLTPEHKLMVGTSGWSYTLSRKDLIDTSAPLPALTDPLPTETVREEVFSGRTPCLDRNKFRLPISSQCLKIKWKIILSRDVQTGEPTTFALDSTFNRDGTIEGHWKIVKGMKNNPAAIIYQLDFEKLGETLSFLVGDENVLFFLDKENQLLTGNSDFSFTLNRRK
jgi:hypothetical protein